MGEWRYSSIILNSGNRWGLVVSFKPQPLYHQGNCPQYSLDRRLGRPQSQSGLCGEEKDLAPARI
jgi:hypothetical protein